MYDLLIRNGTVIDGSGDERQVADIAVKDGLIARIGAVSPSDAREVVDADGLVVAPGFIDPHTHYDAQLFWDHTASPSPYHGVTTVIGGLCGFTLQPMTPESAQYIVPMLSQVEDIPLVSLEAGVPCDWNGFGQFRDRLAGRTAINCGFSTGHSAIRRMVMGERATQGHASAQDIERMQALLASALEEGALGFSTSNSPTHNDHTGGPVPSRFASHEEFVALAGVCRDYEGSSVEIQPGLLFDEDTARLMSDMSLASERVVTWNAQFTSTLDQGERDTVARQLSMSDYARERGGDVVGLTVPITANAHFDLARGGVFDIIPGWDRLFRLSRPERLTALRDATFRAYLRDCAFAPAAQAMQIVRQLMDRDFVMVERGHHAMTRRFEGRTIGQAAEELGRDPLDTLFDLALEDELETLFTFADVGEDANTYRYRLGLWRDDRLCVGGSDAGAHVETIDTFGYFTRMLERPVRQHGVLSLEECVHHITQAPARFLGLKRRGTLREGWHADITIFDPSTVARHPLQSRADLPGGAHRLYAEADGICHVFVNGSMVIDHGRYTGAVPGSFLTRGKDTRTVSRMGSRDAVLSG